MNIVVIFRLNINKRPLRHYGSTSIGLRLLRDTLVDSCGLGWAGQLWNLYGAGIWVLQMDAVGEEWTKTSSIFL